MTRLPDVATLVPHAATMLLLDKISAVSNNSLTSEITIRPDSTFCDGLAVGAWVGIEYMAQTVAAFSGYQATNRGEPVKLGFLLGARSYKSKVPRFTVGQRLTIHVEQVLMSGSGVGAFDCEIFCDGHSLIKTSLTVFQPESVEDYLGGQRND